MSFWDSVKETVGDVAPMLGSALGGPAGGAVGSMVANALGVEDDPKEIQRALEEDPEAAVKLQRLEKEHERELRRMNLEAETTRLTEINKTMRAELDADGWYKSGWRPLFGYGAALAWVGQIGAVIYAVVGEPENAGKIIEALGSLTGMWGIALAVLGVNVTQRSKDKQLKAGQKPSGLIESIAKRIGG